MPSGQSVVKPGDVSPAINVVNWFIAVVTALFVGTRIATKVIRCLTIGRDDIIILLATVRPPVVCWRLIQFNACFRSSPLLL